MYEHNVPLETSTWLWNPSYVIGIPWWRHQMETFSVLLTICAGNSPVTSAFPAHRPVTGNLMFSLVCARINGWVNNLEAGDLRRRRANYEVSVIYSVAFCCYQTITWTNEGSCQWIAKQQIILIFEFEIFLEEIVFLSLSKWGLFVTHLTFKLIIISPVMACLPRNSNYFLFFKGWPSETLNVRS